MEIAFTPIGYVENEFDLPTPVDEMQRSISRIVIREDLAEGLEGIEQFEKLLVIFHFHLAPKSYQLRQHPRGDRSRPKRGVFALHSPTAPTPSA